MREINKNNSGSLRLDMKEINKIILVRWGSFMFNLNALELFY
jgi:hypothetical protein